MQTYLGMPATDVRRRIAWNENDPNLLEMGLPGGMQVCGWAGAAEGVGPMGCGGASGGRAAFHAMSAPGAVWGLL